MKKTDLTLEFGSSNRWQIECSGAIASLVSRPGSVLGPSDVAALLAERLASPIDFPSLDQMVLPGDSLVLAVDATLPCLETLVAEAAAWFCNKGTLPSNLAVVLAEGDEESQKRVSQSLEQRLGEPVSVQIHDPDDSDQLAYLGANLEADAIYINRTIFDADVVVPIMRTRATNSLDDFGSFSIFPLLSDRATIGQFFRLSSLSKPAGRKKLRAWAEEAAQCTGFMTTIQVIPAGNEMFVDILVGANLMVKEAAQRQMAEAWIQSDVMPESELVLALIDGRSNHSWRGIARVLWAAEQQVRSGGSLVICSEANLRVGGSVGRLRAVEEMGEDLLQKINNDSSDDAIAAALLQRITESRHVYLVSRTSKDVLESLGIGAIENESELQHLIAQFDSVGVLESASNCAALLPASDRAST